jgi:endonuclease YncB( thermonuclease family)
LLAIFNLACVACTAEEGTTATGISPIYWSDGDSGRIDGERFRLANVDAPETGNVGARGGAECEAERRLGFEAKQFMVETTRNAVVSVTSRGEPDRYGRIVVSISVIGRDLAELGIEAGHLRPWPHLNDRPLGPKPDWC